jgi:hypothetical protein
LRGQNTPEEDDPTSQKYAYTDPQLFIKFGDVSDSEYTYFGLLKDETSGLYSNTDLIMEKLDDPTVVKTCSERREANMAYDRIRVHMVYGF